MPTQIKGQPTSAEVIARLKAEGRPVALSFSCGKDSIAAWIALEDAGVEVVPVYMYSVPPGTLRFVEDDVAYFESSFGVHIHQYPHPAYFAFFNHFICQAPQNLGIIEASCMPEPKYPEMWRLIKDDLGLPQDTWVADGVRAADSIVRRASFVRHGVMKASSRKVSVIADWLKAEVMAAIERRGIALPIDYELFGRSFDGLDYRFLAPMRDKLPDDYARLLEIYPMAELDIARHEHYGI